MMADSNLRARLRQNPTISQDAGSGLSAKEVVMELNKEEEKVHDEARRRTYGRTPDGKVFTVPQTHDMVSQLLSPRQPKNLSDLIVLLILGLYISGILFLPRTVRIPLYGATYLFWRMSYNAGIGYLLRAQSEDRRLVYWARKSRIFEKPPTPTSKRAKLHRLFKRELEAKIPKDYCMEEAPIEYNTWLVFRRLVDLILLCDFVTYCLFAYSCAQHPADEYLFTTVARWIAGLGLFLFNMWVKLDAHRVVKDFAWYWGDFFFLVDQELTFDGVFEMAPHPMYSVGYAGYYGISMITASYKVLFISIVAHLAQFAFLILVENPHIEKTYNAPPPRKRVEGSAVHDNADAIPANSDLLQDITLNAQPSNANNFLGAQSADLHRVPNLSVYLLVIHVAALAFFTPDTPLYQGLFVAAATFWRFWYTLGIGFLLNRQSSKKSWTRHFIKFGESSEEAWRQWKGLYHISMTMCYSYYIAAAWKMYTLPPDWTYGFTTLRHVVGVALISLHLWTVFSIYEELGEFGWFYGDFFFNHASKLTYSGIYRYLNNPERILGLAGLWGFACITFSRAIFTLALVSHVLSLAFIQFVERPHMQKLYGESLRTHSGVSKTIRRNLPLPLQNMQNSVDRMVDRAADFIEDIIDAAHPRFSALLKALVLDATSHFRTVPARISITRVADDSRLQGFDRADYALDLVEGPTSSPASFSAERDRRSGREGENGRQAPETRSGATDAPRSLIFSYGEPIVVRWAAPPHHSHRDWVGLYAVSDNTSRELTRLSSRGRWVATNAGMFDTARADAGIVEEEVPVRRGESVTGEMRFEGDKLWWTTGVFEFRYHHDGKHNVMAISRPFEIRIAKFEDLLPSLSSSVSTREDDAGHASRPVSHLLEHDVLLAPMLDAQAAALRNAVEQALLPLIRNCFDRDPDIAPGSADEGFGGLAERDGKYAKRVVFAVQLMFGVEFAPEVVRADGNVRNLAWRIVNAKKVLAPYSLKHEANDEHGKVEV